MHRRSPPTPSRSNRTRAAGPRAGPGSGFHHPQPAAYPISAYSYLLMARRSEIAATKQAVEAQYVHFLACHGQKAAGVLGYSPLPPNLVQADFDAVGAHYGNADTTANGRQLPESVC